MQGYHKKLQNMHRLAGKLSSGDESYGWYFESLRKDDREMNRVHKLQKFRARNTPKPSELSHEGDFGKQIQFFDRYGGVQNVIRKRKSKGFKHPDFTTGNFNKAIEFINEHDISVVWAELYNKCDYKFMSGVIAQYFRVENSLNTVTHFNDSKGDFLQICSNDILRLSNTKHLTYDRRRLCNGSYTVNEHPLATRHSNGLIADIRERSTLFVVNLDDFLLWQPHLYNDFRRLILNWQVIPHLKSNGNKLVFFSTGLVEGIYKKLSKENNLKVGSVNLKLLTEFEV